MKKLECVKNINKGDVIFVKSVSRMWDGEKKEYYNYCFEYCFQIVRDNPKTFGCKYLNGPYKGSGFNWVKGYDLTKDERKSYYLLENNEPLADIHYRL